MDTYWPLHTPLKREILTLHTGPSTILEGHRVRKCAFWKKFLPQLANDNDGGNKKKKENCGPHCCNSGSKASPGLLFLGLLLLTSTSSISFMTLLSINLV